MANILSTVNSSFSLADLDLITFGKNRNFSDIVVGNVVTPSAVYDGAIAKALLPATQIGWKYITNIQFDMDAVRNSFGRQLAAFTSGAINLIGGANAIFSLPVMFTDIIMPQTYVVVQLLNTEPLTNIVIDPSVSESPDYKIISKSGDEESEETSIIEYVGLQTPEGQNEEVKVFKKHVANTSGLSIELSREVFNNNVFATYEEQKIDSKTGWVEKENNNYIAKEGQTFDSSPSSDFRIIETEVLPPANDKVLYEDLIINPESRVDNGGTTDTKNDSRNILLKDVAISSQVEYFYVDSNADEESVKRQIRNGSLTASEVETTEDDKGLKIYLSYMSVKDHILREAAKLRWKIFMLGYTAYGKSFYFKPIVTSLGAHVVHYRFYEWEEDSSEISQTEKNKQGGESEGVQKVVKRGWRRSAEFGVTTPPAVSQDLLDQIDDQESVGLIKNAADYRWGVYNVSPEALLISDKEKQEKGFIETSAGDTPEKAAEEDDDDETPLTYKWSMPSKPSGSSASLSRSNTPNPSFGADVKGKYIASLTVGYDGVLSSPSAVVITAEDPEGEETEIPPVVEGGPNLPPVAVATMKDGSDNEEVLAGTRVTLNGGESYDPNGDPLTYSWEIINKPSGSRATLNNPNSVNPSFIPDDEGVFVIELTVSDGVYTSTTVVVIVAVNTEKEDIEDIPIAFAGNDMTVKKGTAVPLDGSGSQFPPSVQEERKQKEKSDTARQKGIDSKRYLFVNGGLSRELANEESALYDTEFISGELTPNERFFPIITGQNLIVDPEASGQLLTETGGVSGSLLVSQYSSLLYQTNLAKEARAWIEYETPGVPTLATLTDWSMLGVATTFSAEANMDVLYDENANRSILFSGSSDFIKNDNRFQNDYLNIYRFDEGKINEQIEAEPALSTTSKSTLTTGVFGQEYSYVNGVSIPIVTDKKKDESFVYLEKKLSPNEHVNKTIVEIQTEDNGYIDSVAVSRISQAAIQRRLDIVKGLIEVLEEELEKINNRLQRAEKQLQEDIELFGTFSDSTSSTSSVVNAIREELSETRFELDSKRAEKTSLERSLGFNILTDLAICLSDNADQFNNDEKDVEALSSISSNIFFNFTDPFPISIKQQSKYIIFVNTAADAPPPLTFDVIVKSDIDKDVIEPELLDFSWPCNVTSSEGTLTKLSNPKQVELTETGEKVRFDYKFEEETIFERIEGTKAFAESRQVSAFKDDYGSFWCAYENENGQINISRSWDNALTWQTYRHIAVPFRVSSTGNYVFKYPRLTKVGKAIYIFYSHDNNILYKVLDPNFLDSIKTINNRKEIEKLIRNIQSKEVSTNASKSTGNMLYKGGAYNIFTDKHGETYLTYETDEGIRIISSNDQTSWEINWKKPEEEDEPIKIHNISDGIIETSPYVLVNKTNLMIYYLADGNLFRKVVNISLLSNRDRLVYSELKGKIDSINPEFVAGTFTDDLNKLFKEKKLDVAFKNAPNLTNDVLGERKIESVREGSLTGYLNKWGVVRLLFRDQASKLRSFLDYTKAGKIDDVETILRTSNG